MNQTKDWSKYAPPGETQVPGFQTNGCGGYSTVHGLESQAIFYGKPTQWSERALVKLSGTDPMVGNTLQKEYAWVMKNGLILASDWPQSPDMTRQEYYADIPQDLIDRSREEFFRDWEVLPPKYNVDPATALLDAPLQVEVYLGDNNYHLVEGLSEVMAFDSLPHSSDPSMEWIVPYTVYKKVENFNQLIIKPKHMNESKVVKSKNSSTVFVCTPVPSMEYLASKASIEGISYDPQNIPDTDSL